LQLVVAAAAMMMMMMMITTTATIILIIIIIIIGVTGIVRRRLRKNLEAVPGKHSIDSLQKAAILRTSHIIRKVLQCEA